MLRCLLSLWLQGPQVRLVSDGVVLQRALCLDLLHKLLFPGLVTGYHRRLLRLRVAGLNFEWA